MTEIHVGAPVELAVTPSGGERVVLTGDVTGWEEHEKGITRIWVWLDPESRERSRCLQGPGWHPEVTHFELGHGLEYRADGPPAGTCTVVAVDRQAGIITIQEDT